MLLLTSGGTAPAGEKTSKKLVRKENSIQMNVKFIYLSFKKETLVAQEVV